MIRGILGPAQLGPRDCRDALISRTVVRLIGVVFPVWRCHMPPVKLPSRAFYFPDNIMVTERDFKFLI